MSVERRQPCCSSVSPVVVHLGKRGWLQALIRQSVDSHRPADVSAKWGVGAALGRLKTGRARARAYLKEALRESGLLYGTPVTELATRKPSPTEGADVVLFLAVVRTLCRMALDIAVLAEGAPGPRPEQLLLLFAAQSHRLDDAEAIHRRIERAWREWPLPAELWTAVEESLEEKAVSLGADPYYGLLLHNGAVYADAYLFGRLSIAYFSSNSFPRQAAERRLVLAAAQKARLGEVLGGLACAERKPGFPTRRAIVRQIDDLRLPEPWAETTREFARRAFERPPPVKRLAKGVKSQDLKRFILEQTVLASLVEGRRSPREVQWTSELAAQLGFEPAALKKLEVSMADFYRRHRDVVDVFTLADGAEVMGQEWVDELATTVRKNSRAIMKEIRKTGQLSVLLARAARGQALTPAEKRLVREQLLDVARAVPALALFAAPGGALLLLALARVLPTKLLPSSFWEEEGSEQGR
jgi:hypothetical protein